MEIKPNYLGDTDLHAQYEALTFEELVKQEKQLRDQVAMYRKNPNPQTGEIIMHYDVIVDVIKMKKKEINANAQADRDNNEDDNESGGDYYSFEETAQNRERRSIARDEQFGSTIPNDNPDQD